MTYSSKNFLFFLFLINFIFNFPILSHSRQFLERDHIIIDLKSGIEWLRCSTGQTWNGKECEGQVVRLSFEEIQDALKQANEQLRREPYMLPEIDLVNVDILNGEFGYALLDYTSHPSIKAPLNN